MKTQETVKSQFNIDAEMVKHVAFLVRLGILEEEARTFSHQFTEIIEYFHLLNEVNSESVIPASESAKMRNVMRGDELKPSMSREDFLKNAPHAEGNYVQVPLVFGEEG